MKAPRALLALGLVAVLATACDPDIEDQTASCVGNHTVQVTVRYQNQDRKKSWTVYLEGVVGGKHHLFGTYVLQPNSEETDAVNITSTPGEDYWVSSYFMSDGKKKTIGQRMADKNRCP